MMLDAFNAPRRYGESDKVATLEWFDALAIGLTKQVFWLGQKSKAVWLVPVRFTNFSSRTAFVFFQISQF